MAQLLDGNKGRFYLLWWQEKIYLGIFSYRAKCAAGLSEHQNQAWNKCQKFPPKSIPYGLKKNNSLALAECIQSCCSRTVCTVVCLYISFNVFVLKLTRLCNFILTRREWEDLAHFFCCRSVGSGFDLITSNVRSWRWPICLCVCVCVHACERACV